MNVTLYSAIYGGYEPPKVQPDLGVRQVLYSDVPVDAPGWEVRVDPLLELPTPMLRAKWWKCRPDLAHLDADITLWVDGSMTVVPGYVEAVLAELGDDDALFMQHPWRECIYDEYLASRGAPKYDADVMRQQIEDYRTAGHPHRWGLWATGAITRRNTDPVIDLGWRWFRECAARSVQDQLSLPVLLRGAEALRWRTVPLDRVPWETWWTIAAH